MEILITIAAVYLGIGFIYALFVLFSGGSSIWAIPINTLGGPISILFAIKDTLKEVKKFKNPNKYV